MLNKLCVDNGPGPARYTTERVPSYGYYAGGGRLLSRATSLARGRGEARRRLSVAAQVEMESNTGKQFITSVLQVLKPGTLITRFNWFQLAPPYLARLKLRNHLLEFAKLHHAGVSLGTSTQNAVEHVLTSG